MGGTSTTLLITGLLLVLIEGATAQSEAFRLQVSSESGTIIEAPRSLLFGESAFVYRALSENEATVAGNGYAEHVSIAQYDYSWPILDPSPAVPAQNLGPNNFFGVSYRNLSNIQFQYASSVGSHAAILWANNAQTQDAPVRLEVERSVENPFAAHVLPDRTPGTENGPEEHGQWQLEGRFALVRSNPLNLTSEGNFTFYWHLGILTIEDGNETFVFESRVWDDAYALDGRIRLRHATWYTASAIEGAIALNADLGPATGNFVVFSKEFRANGIDRMAIDSHSKIEGDLPLASTTVGPAIWLSGDLDAILKAHQNSGADSKAQEYSISIDGRLRTFSVGGGGIQRWNQATAASIGAGLLAFLAYVFRDGLKELVARLGGPLFAKLRKDRVLDHEDRDLIKMIIDTQPGVHFMGVIAALRSAKGGAPVGRGVTQHHLEMLEKYGFIQSLRAGRYRRYFPANKEKPTANMQTALLLSQPLASIAACVVARPGLTTVELFADLRRTHDLSRSTLGYHVDRLRAANLVRGERQGKAVALFPTPDLLISGPMATSKQIAHRFAKLTA